MQPLYVKIYLIVFAVLFAVTNVFGADWQSASHATLRLSYQGKTVGTAFLFETDSGPQFLTAAHVVDYIRRSNQMCVDLATEHNDETLKKVLNDVIPLLRKEGIVIPLDIKTLDILTMPAPQLLDKLLAKKNFVPSTKLARLSLQVKLNTIPEDKTSKNERVNTLKQANRLCLEERFPTVVTERHMAVAINPVIVNQKDDLAIFSLTPDDFKQIDSLKIKPLKGSQNPSQHEINSPIMAWNCSYFPPFLNNKVLPSRGHILDSSSDSRLYVYLSPMTEGSSGSAVIDKDGKVVGMVLNQIRTKTRNNDENTGIFEVLPVARINELLENHLK